MDMNLPKANIAQAVASLPLSCTITGTFHRAGRRPSDSALAFHISPIQRWHGGLPFTALPQMSGDGIWGYVARMTFLSLTAVKRGLLFTMLPKQSRAGSCGRYRETNFHSYLLPLEGDSPRALKNLGVVLAVGAAEPVPPGEVEGAVEARVDVV